MNPAPFFLVALCLGSVVQAEPFLGRDVLPLALGKTTLALGGRWGASRGAFDDAQHAIGFSQTPGVALSRGASLEVRQGAYWNTELRLVAGWAAQEVKIDRGMGASGYLGADTARGEGPTDLVVTWSWAPSLAASSAVALEAGCKIPVARGPERARDLYDRLGTGGVSFPVGLRASHTQGAITGFASGFIDIPVARNVSTWYRANTGGHYRPGGGYWFAGGAEVRPPEGPGWAVEIAKSFTGRDRGDAALAAGFLPATAALIFVPSVAIPVGPAAELHLAAELPLAGKNVYQMFSGAVSLRVRV